MKKILSCIQKNSLLSSMLGSLIIIILLKLADFLFLKSNLRIIDFVFLFLFLFIIIMLIVVYRKQKSIPVSRDEGQLREDFKKHKEGYKKFVEEIDKKIRALRQDLSRIYDKAKKYEEIDTSPEIIFILETLGAQLNRRITERGLFGDYLREFRPKTAKEANLNFNIKINWLKTHNVIELFETEDNYNKYVKITDLGFEYLRQAKIKIAEKKEEDSQ